MVKDKHTAQHTFKLYAVLSALSSLLGSLCVLVLSLPLTHELPKQFWRPPETWPLCTCIRTHTHTNWAAFPPSNAAAVAEQFGANKVREGFVRKGRCAVWWWLVVVLVAILCRRCTRHAQSERILGCSRMLVLFVYSKRATQKSTAKQSKRLKRSKMMMRPSGYSAIGWLAGQCVNVGDCCC